MARHEVVRGCDKICGSPPVGMRSLLVLVMLGSHSLAAAQSPPVCASSWSPPYAGSYGWTSWHHNGSNIGKDGLHFVDVNGDGQADAVAVSYHVNGWGTGNQGVYVRYATSGLPGFETTTNTLYTSNATYDLVGDVRTMFADVNADTFPDAVMVNSGGPIVVRINQGGFFGPAVDWTLEAFYGTYDTFLADVNNDQRADLIAIEASGRVYVRLSSAAAGGRFSPAVAWTTTKGSRGVIGELGTTFADVTGDGRADMVILTNSGIYVRPETAGTFPYPVFAWTTSGWQGQHGTLFADVDHNGRADAIAVGDGSIEVRLSTGSSFAAATSWHWPDGYPYGGNYKLAFAPVSNWTYPDLVVADTDQGITGRVNYGTGFGCFPL